MKGSEGSGETGGCGRRQRGSRPRLLGALACVALLMAVGCGPQAATPGATSGAAAATPGAASKPLPTVDPYRFERGTTPEDVARYLETRARCPRLDDRFVRVISLPDPQRRAEQSGIEYDNGRLAVMLRRAPRADWDDLVRRYHLGELGRSQDFMDAFVPLESLCELSSDPGVESVIPLVHASPSGFGAQPTRSPAR